MLLKHLQSRCSHPLKVSLGVGAYRTNEGKPWILPCVKTAERILAEKTEKEEINHEYLPRQLHDSCHQHVAQ